MMVGHFVEVYRRRGLKVNADKSKVMVLDGEEGLRCKIHVHGVDWSRRQSSYIWGMF